MVEEKRDQNVSAGREAIPLMKREVGKGVVGEEEEEDDQAFFLFFASDMVAARGKEGKKRRASSWSFRSPPNDHQHHLSHPLASFFFQTEDGFFLFFIPLSSRNLFCSGIQASRSPQEHLPLLLSSLLPFRRRLDHAFLGRTRTGSGYT